ncbi:MAG: histidine phosphatase family protein, partial [Rickettsiales bacterium]|nr:histidine phosphatase family protein [Rickettsiales bacterium]
MRVWLVRHGEALGKIYESARASLPDSAIPLTEFGADQARHAGNAIKNYYAREGVDAPKLRIFHSPALRTTQTQAELAAALGESRIASQTPDDRLREHPKGAPLEDMMPRTRDFSRNLGEGDLVVV